MTLDSIDSLVDDLTTLELIAPQYQEKLRNLVEQRADPHRLCKALIKRDLLTPFQANLLLKGRGEELRRGNYILLERLGEGGMGQVFKARQVEQNRLVALKTLRADRVENPMAMKRFRREMRVATDLSHPNLITLYEAEIDHCFLTMEYLQGRDLARIVQEDGPLPVELACEHIRQAALGLQYAHENGLIHRDIKPHNLFLTLEDEIKILDLGLAKLLEDEEGSHITCLTQEGVVVGTVDYLAPEQARAAKHADGRSDLYSLGCTFYHLLAGRPPFVGDSALDKLLKHQEEHPEPLEKIRPDVPRSVAAIVRRLMTKNPDERCQSGAELVGWLTSLDTATTDDISLPIATQVDEVIEVPLVPIILDDTATELVAQEETTEVAPPKKRYRWLIWGLAIFFILAILSSMGKKAKKGRKRNRASITLQEPNRVNRHHLWRSHASSQSTRQSAPRTG